MPGVLMAVKAVGLAARPHGRARRPPGARTAEVSGSPPSSPIPTTTRSACAGTVALHADEPGFRFVLVHVTSGEGGMISDPSLATRENLGAVREEEDRRSWIALGQDPGPPRVLAVPRRRAWRTLPFDELVERVAAILREEHPDVVITFGPRRHHRPCRITSRSAGRRPSAFHALPGRRARRVPAAVVLVHPELDAGHVERGARRAGQEPIDPTQPFQPRGVPDAPIGVDVDCSSDVAQASSRRSAITARRRTTSLDCCSDEERLDAAARAHGIVAWPPWEPGDDVVTDVFEGLD